MVQLTLKNLKLLALLINLFIYLLITTLNILRIHYLPLQRMLFHIDLFNSRLLL